MELKKNMLFKSLVRILHHAWFLKEEFSKIDEMDGAQ